MKIILHSEEDLELVQFQQPGMEVEATDEQAHFSALQMFATSLGLCTYSMLVSYGETISVSADELRIRVRWSYADKPYRIGSLAMDIRWPGLPDSRLKAAQLAANHCTIHHTLEKPPEVTTVVHQ